jgi:hypothetical protein
MPVILMGEKMASGWGFCETLGPVIASDSEAIQRKIQPPLDCFVALLLAMTA